MNSLLFKRRASPIALSLTRHPYRRQFQKLETVREDQDMKRLTQPIHIAETEDERHAIYAFRYRVYIEEMRKPYRHADHQRKILRDALDEKAILLYATNNHEITGTVRINWGEDEDAFMTFSDLCALANFANFPADSLSFCSRLMVHQQHRYSAVAAALSTAAYLKGRERNTQFNFVHCAPRLLPLFKRMGFRQYTQPFHDPEIGAQVPLVLVFEDVEHLRASRSPFLVNALEQHNSNRAARWFVNKFFDAQSKNLICKEMISNYESNRLCTAAPTF